jgi:hypothetical protein
MRIRLIKQKRLREPFQVVAATRQPTGLELGNPFPLFGTVLILRVEELFDARSEGFVDFLIRREYRTLGGPHIRRYLDSRP